MQTTPAMIGRRYSPLIVLGVIQLLLVVVAPSVQGNNASSSSLASGATDGSGQGSGGSGATGGTTSGQNGATGSGGQASGARTTGVGGASGGSTSGGTGFVSGAGSVAGGDTSGGGGSGAGGTGSTALDRSHCDANGNQIGVTFYMPACRPVWHGGDNGGATMTGVFPDHINYVYYNAQANAEVNAVLEQVGLAASAEQGCEARQAFNTEVNKRWDFAGRKVVSLDGSGNNQGSSQQSPCNFPYFQGQCSLTPPDPPCERAEADVIASMKPAFVLAPVADPAFYNELAKKHIIVWGGETQPDSYHQQVAPYYYDIFMNGTRDVQLTAEYYCKQLQGKPVRFAGSDVTNPPGSLSPPKRKLAIIYPQTNGDPTATISANYFLQMVNGGLCGSSSDGAQGYPYASDITTAEQQSTTTVAALKSNHVTTVVFFGDPIAPVFLSNTADSQGYHPEFLMTGTGLVDYDVLAQLYNKNVWRFAFGISTLADNIPFPQSDAAKAWHDAGNAGLPDATENLQWSYFAAMGNALQLAAPAITPASVRQGLFNAAPLGGDHLHTLQEFGRPNDYTSLRDARIVWYCPTANSPINNKPGSYVSVSGGQRYQVGSVPAGAPNVFPNGPCAAN